MGLDIQAHDGNRPIVHRWGSRVILVRLVRRVVYWLRVRTRQDELREELELHRELLVDDLQRRGVASEAARVAARRAMGHETLMREEARSVWLASGLESVLKDWRYAWRGLRRSPAFTTVVVLTLALTVAANAVVFSVVQHVLLEPLPYPEGSRIVMLGMESVADPQVGQFGIGTEVLQRMIVGSRTLEEFAAVEGHEYRIGNDPEERASAAASVTPSFFSMVRVRPMLGRAFTPDDARPGAPPVMMIGFASWQLRFSGAPDVVGRVVTVNGIPRAIVGVLPDHFDIPMSLNETPEIWLPLNLDSSVNVDGFARLRPGATSEMASRELQSITRELPDTGSARGYRVRATTAQDTVDPRDRRAIELLFVTVCCLVLIACANIANLLLMRGWTRRRELAVRLALGAGRPRLARQLLTESVLLAVLGGGVGLLIAWQGLRALIAIDPGGLTVGFHTSLDGVHIDATVLGWTAVVSVATGLLFGVGPAVLAGDRSLGDVLRTGGRTAVGGGAARRLRNGLVVAEIALSLIFLSAAGLLVRSFLALARTPVGYDAVGLVAVDITLARQPALADRTALERMLVSALRDVPGVTEVALGGLPQTNVQAGPFAIEEPTGPQLTDLPFSEMPFVSPEYFRVARIPLIEGRTFQDNDPVAASRELVVNAALARRFWPGGHAVGSRLRVGKGAEATWLTVVGIAGDIHLPGINGDLFNLQMYRPTSAGSEFQNTVVMRATSLGSALEPTLRRAVEGAGVAAKFRRVLMAESVLYSRVLARPRFVVAVFGVFAIIALVVSAAGLYGIIAYAVTQRTREIGVRVALGADPLAVARLVLGDSGRLVTMGACLGLLGAYAGTRVLASFLYQVGPTDPTALGGAVLLLTVVALIATLVPMRRALRIDPMDALRTD
jgi:putative ABC transport system permease protein